MPEAKNTFLKAKMNKDLDDRLLPNGEYRDAQNILVGKSEEDSAGTLQLITGNTLINATAQEEEGYYIIGYYMDSTNNRIFTFVTNHTGVNFAPVTAHCSIRVYDVRQDTYTTLVEGSFLNFSTNKANFNVNLLEDLLFWTDNRNQPRKINVTTALNNAGYYTAEEHISVAKYHPYQPISFLKQEIEKITAIVTAGTVFRIAKNNNIEAGMTVLGINLSTDTQTIQANEYITVKEVDQTNETYTEITLSDSASLTVNDTLYFLICTMTDKSNDETWPGDPKYLENKFVRFGYRFKFDDNEYSIFSPFTQIAFIPKQKGYFLNGQEDNAVSSTIVDWFENSVNDIELIIPLPDKASNVSNSYKITEIEILYKESDAIPVKVVDTINLVGLSGDNYNDSFYSYSYQSRKPIRTLPDAQTVRVYDKVPVKAKTQEIISNRVVYGNFLTKHTPPASLNYNVSIQDKVTAAGRVNFVEFPNHTVKQNRNYQIGFVLSDKFGRHSDVILSNVTPSASNGYGGSTVYAEYIPDDPQGSNDPDAGFLPDGVIGWFGNSILVDVKSAITGGTGANAPGLYATEKGTGFDVEQGTSTTITDTTYTFEITTVEDGNASIPAENDYMRGKFVDYVKVTGVTGTGTNTDPYIITTDGRVNDLYEANPLNDPDIKFAYSIKPLGWYSYKIVVKQTEQEYYNVYLPSAVSGGGFLSTKSTDTDASISYITLINDNINKVPRDLAEVGPDQKQYRSSVELYGRVQPTVSGTTPNFVYGNRQFYPLNFADTSTSVGNTENVAGTGLNNQDSVYQFDSDPILARVSTHKQFGISEANFLETNADRFQLTVYETEPVVSNLDIYWESTQSGLISDLNWDVAVGFSGPTSLEALESTLTEDDISGSRISDDFFPLDREGTQIATTNIPSFTVTDGNGDDATSDFVINQNPDGSYYISTNNTFVYEYNSETNSVYTFDVIVEDNDQENSEWGQVEFTFDIPLGNVEPSFLAQTISPQEYYYFDEEATTATVIRNFNTQNNPLNGSVKSGAQQNGLRWSLGGADASLFTLDETSGELKPSTAGVAAGLNTYTIEVTLKDSASNNGEFDTNALSVTQTYKIVKGFTPMNMDPTNRSISGEFTFSGSTVPPGTGHCNKEYWCYYLSDNTLTASQLPGYTSGTYANLQLCPSTYPAKTPNTPVRIGDALSQGAFTFGIEGATISNFEFPPNGPITASVTFKAYYRANSSSSWVAVDDSNNYGNASGETFGITNLFQYIDGSSDVERYAFFSKDTPGEYAFVVYGYGNSNISGDGMFFDATATLRDLHYTGENQAQQVYQYEVYEGGGSVSASTATTTGTTQVVYSDSPLVEYSTQFYTGSGGTTDFSEVYTPPSDQFYIVQLIDGPTDTPSVSTRDRIGDRPTTIDITAGVLRIQSNGEVFKNNNPVAQRYNISDSTFMGGVFDNRSTPDGTNSYFDHTPI